MQRKRRPLLDDGGEGFDRGRFLVDHFIGSSLHHGMHVGNVPIEMRPVHRIDMEFAPFFDVIGKRCEFVKIDLVKVDPIFVGVGMLLQSVSA